MRILYVAMRHDYGQPDWGPSFEHTNFFDSLSSAGHEIVYFDFMSLLDKLGRRRMNRRLLDTARSEEPDLMFTVLYRDELQPRTVREISNELSTLTLNWFCDDHWRFESFTARWAPCFNWSVTTASSALAKYEQLGYHNVIKSQWGCNDHLYRRLDLPLVHDVSFVGYPHGDRRATIEALRAAGVDVLTRGRDWPEGRVSQEEMIRIFNQSRINLNLSNASHPVGPVLLPRSPLRRAAGRAVRRLPLGERMLELARPGGGGAASARGIPQTAVTYAEQIKGRNFEVPGCGGFVLTAPADDLEGYYAPGQEVAVFRGLDELVHQIGHYLSHEDERRDIAEAGYRRTLLDHTYERRFQEIFETIGLPATSPGGGGALS